MWVRVPPPVPFKMKAVIHNWNGKDVGYCHACDAWYIICGTCKNSSCNGGGCSDCCDRTEGATDRGTNFSLIWSENYKSITSNWQEPLNARTFYISGHLDITKTEFTDNYIPELERLVHIHKDKIKFVVGDARGADVMAQKWLRDNVDKKRVTVYHMFDSPRFNAGYFSCVGGYKTDEERDAVMTAVSIGDIAFIRKGREKSGTAKNIIRRGDSITSLIYMS